MGEHQLSGRPPVPLKLRRSGRARRISLRVSQLDGRVTLTLPRGVSEREALAFAREKESWIRANLAARPAPWAPEFGAEIPVGGVPRTIVPGPGRRVQLAEMRIAVPEGNPAARLHRFLRELARDRLVAAADDYAGRLGQPYSRISLRDTRSRWGSCSSAGALGFSWRLVLAPDPVLRYVAAHEVAHLAEMNHSPRFWDRLAHIHGPFDAPRRWLRENGASLHRYRFDRPAD